MLNDTRMKVYINAYTIRLQKGQKLENIDKDYLSLKRLTQEEVNQIHKKLGL